MLNNVKNENTKKSQAIEAAQELAFEFGHNDDGSGYILTNEEFDKCIELALTEYSK